MTEYLLTKDAVFDEQNKNRPLASISPGWTGVSGHFKFEYQAFRDGNKVVWYLDPVTVKEIKSIYQQILKPMNVRMLQYRDDSVLLYHPKGRINALLYAKQSLLSHIKPINTVPLEYNRNNLEWDNLNKIWRVKLEIQKINIKEEKIEKCPRYKHDGGFALSGILLNYDNESIKELYLRNRALAIFEVNSTKINSPREYLNAEQQKETLASFEKDKQLAQDWIANQWKWIEYIDKPGLRMIDKKYGWNINNETTPKKIVLNTSALKFENEKNDQP